MSKLVCINFAKTALKDIIDWGIKLLIIRKKECIICKVSIGSKRQMRSDDKIQAISNILFFILLLFISQMHYSMRRPV